MASSFSLVVLRFLSRVPIDEPRTAGLASPVNKHDFPPYSARKAMLLRFVFVVRDE